MSKRAVLIGINYENAPIDAPLKGCVNDVINMKQLLIEKYGFPEENIRMLIDSNNDGSLPLPTAQNITDAMTAAIQESADGDVVFFHYSGHGSQQQDETGEEADGKDEFLVSHDAVPITDDFLKQLLAQAPAGLKFTFIADCCHSGSMLDQPQQDIEVTGDKSTTEGDAYADGVAPEGGSRDITSRSLSAGQLRSFIASTHGDAATFFANNPFVPNELAERQGEEAGTRDWLSSAIGFIQEQAQQAAAEAQEGGEFQGEPVPVASLAMTHCVLISGCMDNQTSADAQINDAFSGALTASLLDSVKRAEGAPSYREIVALSRDYLATHNYAQNPTLSCPDGVADLPFICEPVA